MMCWSKLHRLRFAQERKAKICDKRQLATISETGSIHVNITAPSALELCRALLMWLYAHVYAIQVEPRTLSGCLKAKVQKQSWIWETESGKCLHMLCHLQDACYWLPTLLSSAVLWGCPYWEDTLPCLCQPLLIFSKVSETHALYTEKPDFFQSTQSFRSIN